MRGITFALLIAFVGCQNNDVEPEFSNNKAYIYRYEGLILNGLPDRDIKKSGLKLTCQVRISRITDDEHILKVISPRLEEFFGIWPRDRFIEAPKLTQRIGLCFTKWYKFDYQRGHIRNIYAPKGVPDLCVNIVKGILNLLPLTIKKSQSSYEMQEQRIEGTCNTKYIIQEDRVHNQTTILQTRDLDNCTNKVVKNIGMAYVRPCPTCPVHAGNTRSTMAVTQKLKYKDTGAFIIYAESQQLYELSPFNEPDGTVVMEARQNLTLIETKDNEEITTIQLKYYGNLNYQFSEDLPQMALHLIKPKSVEARFAEVLQQLMQQKQSQIHVKTPPNFLELIELSRMATLENLESLWRQCGNRQEFRCWFLSAVAAAGTTNTFMFLKQRIQNEELTVMGSAITLVLAFHLTKPDNLTLTAAADLLADHRVQKTLLLHKLSYLGYGSMTNKYCSTSSSCPAHILQPLHNLAISAAANHSHEEDIMLALMAIGNAGEPASIKCIKRFLPALSPATSIFSFKVHAKAIMSLRKIARKEPAKVQEIVFQIFLDRSLQPQLRMMACLVLFEIKPPLSLMIAMASFLQSESSVQVASFVYSHMEVLSGGGIPQLYNLATACRIALKLLGPRFHPRSFRYSTVLEINGYHPYFRAGAIGRAYLLHDDKLPSAIFTKIRGYYASSAMDIAEVAVLFKSLPDLLMEQEKQFSRFSFKRLEQLGRLLREWKGLSIENTPLRAYIKLCSQIIIFGNVDEEFQQLVKVLTKPEEMEKWLKQMVAHFQKGFSGNLIHPLWAGEIRHIVPTAVGFPLEFGLYSTSIMHAAAEVKGQISPPPMENFRPEQLLESNMQLSTDINASLYMDIVATMGINTPYFQNGLEFHANFNASMSVKFHAELDMKKEIFKFETIPALEETQLLAVRTILYAISRNIDDPDSSKMSPVLPEVPGPDIPNEQWKPSQSERNFKDYGIKYSRDYDMTSNASDPGEEHHYQERKPKCLDVFCGKLFGYQTCLTMKSCNAIFRKTYLRALVEDRDFRLTVKSEAAGTKIQLEIQGGVDSKATLLGLSEKDSDVNVMTNQTNTKEHQQIGEHEQCSQMTESKPTGLVAVLRTIHSGEILTRFRLVLRADLHTSKPTVQVVISDFKESSGMKLCADLAILDSQMAEGTLKWGQDCRDYKIATQVAYGQYNHHPAMQIKFEWAKIPSEGQAAASWLLKFLPGIVYEHGLVQKEQKNPPQEATVVVALTSPQTCDLIFRLPNVTIYDTDMMLPFTIPVGQYTEASATPPHAWNFISNVPLSVLENLKARCSVSKDSVTTFNGVRFNYTIPPNVYYILTQDCSSELKFLVMAKRTEEPYVQRSIHLTVANHEIDMYTSNGLVKVMVNGTEIPEEDLPYSSKSDDILITREKNGLLLKAPKAGIDALYYDGHVLETKVGFKMSGKTCGICGRNDVEYKQEYKMPSGSVARDAMSFVQSWTLHEDAYNRAKAQISLD